MSKTSLTRICALCGLGMVFQFGACLNAGLARKVIEAGVQYASLEFLFDNPAVIDLFPE